MTSGRKKDKTELTGAQPKEAKVRVMMKSLKSMKACCKERGNNTLSIPINFGRNKGLKSKDLGKLYCTGWSEGIGKR